VGERDAAGDDDVLPRLLLELPDGGDRIAAEDRRRLPAGIGQRAGDDVLLHPVQVGGDPGRVLGLQRPVAAEVLEGAPAQQQGVGGLVLAAGLGQLIGAVGPGSLLRVEPVADHLDRAVERDVLRESERPHGGAPPSAGVGCRR
jgi:hypothetical protein